MHRDQVLIEVGDVVHGIPLVVSGVVRVSRMDEFGNELLLYYLQSGQSCAMSFTCCNQKVRSQVKAVVEEDAVLWWIPMEKFNEWMNIFPSWKTFIMQTIRSRFMELLSVVDQLAFKKLDDRLWLFLQNHAKISGSNVLHQSHEEIAQHLATSREVVSRLLKRLEQDGKVILYRNEVKLRDV